MVCRNQLRGEEAQREIIEHSNNQNVFLHIVNLSSVQEMKSFVENFQKNGTPLDVLVNNVGVMVEKREVTEEGNEITFATNTLSTFILTNLLLPTLNQSSDPRVITVSSGGMLTEKCLVRDAYEDMKEWLGRTLYARTKRHQLCLTEKWTKLYSYSKVQFYSMHPGWVDTPGVRTSMPEFFESFKNKLRTAEQGSDTIHWLAVTKRLQPKDNGQFFRDRKHEIMHFCISSTKYSDKEVDALWLWCCEASGLDPNEDYLHREVKTLVIDEKATM